MVMGTALPIPAELWERMQQFLRSEAAGQVVLHFRDGRVQLCELVACAREVQADGRVLRHEVHETVNAEPRRVAVGKRLC